MRPLLSVQVVFIPSADGCCPSVHLMMWMLDCYRHLICEITYNPNYLAVDLHTNNLFISFFISLDLTSSFTFLVRMSRQFSYTCIVFLGTHRTQLTCGSGTKNT